MSFLVVLLLLGWQTSRQSTYTYDLNGNRVETQRVDQAGGVSVESFPGMNGRAPVERVEERIIESGPSGRIVERTIRPYVNGTPGLARKVRIEERGDTVRTSVYEADLNGGFRLAERATAQTQGERTITTLERPTINGGFDLFEKRQTVASKTQTGVREEMTAWRPNENGRLQEASRVITERGAVNGQEVENTTVYRPGTSGSLELAEQTATRSVKRPDGSETRESDVFTTVLPGIANGRGTPRLRERVLVERTATAGGVVETLSVARPSLSDPNRLGGFEKVSERICTGQCQ